MNCTIVSQSEEQTQALGASLSKLLRGGDVVLLYGEPGTGKTALARGIGRGLGVAAVVNSPTFTLINEYPLKHGRRLVHMDLYRLDEQGVWQLGLEEYFDARSICVIEWPRGIEHRPALQVTLTYDPEGRRIAITGQDRFLAAVEP